MIPKPIAVAIVCLVSLVWAGAFVAQFLVADYVFDGYLHTVFLIIVGGALGLSRKSNSDDKTSTTNPITGLIQQALGNGNSTPPAPPPAAPASPDAPPHDGPPDPPRPGGAHRALLALTPAWRTAT